MVILYCFAFRRALLDFDLVQHCRIISKNYVITLEFMTFYGIRMTSGRVTKSREILSSSQGLESRCTTFPVISNSKIINKTIETEAFTFTKAIKSLNPWDPFFILFALIQRSQSLRRKANHPAIAELQRSNETFLGMNVSLLIIFLSTINYFISCTTFK